MQYNKLVRDLIPEIIQGNGEKASFTTADTPLFHMKLEEKLLEEVYEYLESKNTEEIADILEILYTIAGLQGVSRETLENIRIEKEKERGGFSKRIILIETERKNRE